MLGQKMSEKWWSRTRRFLSNPVLISFKRSYSNGTLSKERCQSNVNIEEYDTCKHFKLLSSQEENQLTSRQLLFVQRQLQQEQKDSFPSFTADETETYASWQFCVVGRFVSWPGKGVSWPASHAVDLLALEWHNQSWSLKYINIFWKVISEERQKKVMSEDIISETYKLQKNTILFPAHLNGICASISQLSFVVVTPSVDVSRGTKKQTEIQTSFINEITSLATNASLFFIYSDSYRRNS